MLQHFDRFEQIQINFGTNDHCIGSLIEQVVDYKPSIILDEKCFQTPRQGRASPITM